MTVDRRLLAVVFLVAAAWAGLASGVHASYGARLIADEPQYVLSAMSLVEDRDLDISDELAQERWRPFHEADLPRQTQPRHDGSELSPHDPLLPVLLAPGVWAFGWQGARATMALFAGALAALLVWSATTRLGVRPRTAVVVVGAFTASAPLSSYGSQMYPELPAALAVTAAAGALLGPPTRARTAVWVLSVVALPWLGVKYALVAAALAACGAWLDRRRLPTIVGVLAVAAVTYVVAHRWVYGGWTVYAAGDHFVDGELTVVGHDPDHLGRTARLLGLLVDRHFGLVAWAPVYLVAVPACAALVRARSRVPAVLLAPFVAGYATATWVALTMHGWWWPGRQVVVVLPVLVLAVARFVDGRPRAVAVTALAGVLGAVTWLWLVFEATTSRLRLIVDFDRTSNPWLRTWRSLLPDQRTAGPGTVALEVLWAAVLAALVVLGWRVGAGRSARRDEDALAGERADADGVTVDLDGRRPVG